MIYNFSEVKNVFLEKKAHFFGNKTADQRSGANVKKNIFLQNFAAKFNQRLECAAPKCWSKYATTNSWEINFSRIKSFETNFLELKGIAEKMNWETEQMKGKIK